MPHASEMVFCAGPDSAHAFDGVSGQPRSGTLDAPCPICKGHGAWNTEIDLVSFRCKRAVCDYCDGLGWVEMGQDPVGLPDVVLAPEGYPKWITRFVSKEEVAAADPRYAPLLRKPGA